jgi:ribonuclease P protein component
LKRRFRLTGSTDFKRVRQLGTTYAHPFIVVIVLPNNMHKSRFAIAAGRSIGNAVQRNRAKRILREAMRASLGKIKAGWDVVILARKPIANAPYSEVSSALNHLLTKANIME